ncbi:MAG: hypothetical protein COB85_02875 [Bacteroidetes bacterium]|nr:MAG: hypothetical protein COB85_02875 [Bacteroidota bacterium]
MKQILLTSTAIFMISLSILAQIPTNGLVANYPFNGNTNDQTSNNNDGSITGGVTLTTDRFGRTDSAYAFDGSGYITIPDAASLKPSLAVSTCAWVFLSDTSTWPHVVSKRYSTTTDPWTSYGLGTNNWGTNTAWSFGVSNGTSGSLVYSDEVTGVILNQWVFLVGTYDGTYVNLYVNGKLVRKEAQTGSIGYSTMALTIGTAVSGQNFNGKIDDVLIYNRALDPCEILEIFDIEMAGSLDLGEIITNASCSGDTDGAIDLTISGGYENGCLGFDGVDDLIDHGAYNRGSNSFTMEAWVLATDTHEIDSQANTGTSGISNQRYLFGPSNTFPSGQATGGVSVGTNGISVYEHGQNYLPAVAVYAANIGSVWNHIAVVYENRLPKIYLNGILVHTGLVGTQSTVHTPIVIGGNFYGKFSGLMDEVRLWNKALSASEVAANYAVCTILPTDPNYGNLIGYWNMNEGSGNTANDVSANGNIGYLNGPVWYGKDSTQFGCASNFIEYQVNWSNGETTDDIDSLIAGTYTVTVTDGSGCGRVDSFTVTEPPLVIANAGIDTSICEGTSVQLNATGGVNYAWSPGTGLNDSTISNPTSNSASTITYTVSVSDAFGCSNSDVMQLTVNSNPSPTIVTSGSTTFCEGDSVILTSSGADSYSWSPGDTTESLTIDTSGTYTVSVIDSNGCSGVSSAETVLVFANPTPTITASGPTTFCEGDSVTLTSSSASSYLWSTGDTTQSINVDSSDYYYVTVTDSNSCSGSSTITSVTVYPNPTSEISSSTSTTFCQGDSVTLSASTAYSYMWSTGDTTQYLSTDTNGTYTVTVTDSLGCSTSSASEVVTVNPMPALDSIVSADATSCVVDDGSISIYVSGGTTPYSYSIDGGSVYFFNSSFGGLSPGNYAIEIADTNNCAVTGPIITIAAPTTPSAPTAGIDSNYCEGDAVADITASGINIQWYTDAGLTTLIGSGSTFSPSSAVGNYSYYATQTDSGCESSSSLVTINIYPNPTPAITVSGGNVLSTGIYANYQWFVDGAILVGETSQSYTATSSGGYWVTVTDSNGCTATTAVESITIIGVEELSMQLNMGIYPNPNTGLFNLDVYSDIELDAELHVLNILGQLIYTQKLNIIGQHTQQIDLRGTTTGLYYLKLISDSGVLSRKMIVE